jgi:hypothetical protein
MCSIGLHSISMIHIGTHFSTGHLPHNPHSTGHIPHNPHVTGHLPHNPHYSGHLPHNPNYTGHLQRNPLYMGYIPHNPHSTRQLQRNPHSTGHQPHNPHFTDTHHITRIVRDTYYIIRRLSCSRRRSRLSYRYRYGIVGCNTYNESSYRGTLQ